MLFYDKIKTPSHQGERCAVINTAGGTCSCCRPIYPLLQPPATSTPAKLPCTNGLPQLAGSCIKENQDLISEILEKLFVFSSVYLTGSGSSLLFVIVMMLLLMQIDAKNNTEYRAACRNDTADQRNDSHRASPLPLSRGTTEVPPGFREQTAFSPGSLSDQNSLVPVYQSSTGSASNCAAS